MKKPEPKQDTMNMFSKRVAQFKNTIPITLKMIAEIDFDTKKIDNIVEVNKVIICAKVLSLTHRLMGKLQVQVQDQSLSESKTIYCHCPKYLKQDPQINQNDYYKFICQVRQDHGQIVVNSSKFKKVQKPEEITLHKDRVQLASHCRQKALQEFENNSLNKNSGANNYNQFDI